MADSEKHPKHASASVAQDTASALDASTSDATKVISNGNLSDAADAPEKTVAVKAATSSKAVKTTTLNKQAALKEMQERLQREERLAEIEHNKKRRKRRKLIRRITLTLVVLIILALVALASAFAANRWWFHDDVEDFKGTWYVAGTSMPVEITDTTIILTEDIAYKYAIDPENKTISLRFGNLTGSGHYRFSLDKQQLAIVDGEFDWLSILLDDAGWSAAAALASVKDASMIDPSLGMGNSGITLFTRKPMISPGIYKPNLPADGDGASNLNNDDFAAVQQNTPAYTNSGSASGADAGSGSDTDTSPEAPITPDGDFPDGDSLQNGTAEDDPQSSIGSAASSIDFADAVNDALQNTGGGPGTPDDDDDDEKIA